jgi:hypothetical protein
MNPPDKFIITETEPTPLIRDFQSFIDYIAANIPYLTPKGGLRGVAIPAGSLSGTGDQGQSPQNQRHVPSRYAPRERPELS